MGAHVVPRAWARDYESSPDRSAGTRGDRSTHHARNRQARFGSDRDGTRADARPDALLRAAHGFVAATRANRRGLVQVDGPLVLYGLQNTGRCLDHLAMELSLGDAGRRRRYG